MDFLILNADVNNCYILMVLCNAGVWSIACWAIKLQPVTLVRCVMETCEILLCQAYLFFQIHLYISIWWSFFITQCSNSILWPQQITCNKHSRLTTLLGQKSTKTASIFELFTKLIKPKPDSHNRWWFKGNIPFCYCNQNTHRKPIYIRVILNICNLIRQLR